VIAAALVWPRTRLDRVMLACVVAVVLIFSVVWRPPIEVTDPHRAQTALLALTVVVLAALPTAYVSGRSTGRGARAVWYGVAAGTLLLLAASLLVYQNLRAQFSAPYEGTLVVTGTDEEFTEFGRAHQALEPHLTPSQRVYRATGRPDAVWDPKALSRHARRMELQYLLCEALLALAAGALFGAGRSIARAAGDVAPARVSDAETPIVRAPARRFAVGFSFPGEVRGRVHGIVSELEPELTRERIFYDAWYRGELARPDMDTYLRDIYKMDSDLIVVVLCPEYERKEWCGLEWRVVRELVKTKESRRVMFLRLDDARIADLLSIDGYLDIDELSDEDVAREILARVRAGTPHASA
jgi:hypothetical protein